MDIDAVITNLEISAGGNTMIAINPDSTLALGSLYKSNGFLKTNVHGVVGTGSISADNLPDDIPNTKLENSSLTLGSTAVSLGATQASNTTYTNIGGDNVVINTSNGAETFTWRQGSAGGSSSGFLELYCTDGSINRLVTFSPLGGVVFTSAIASDSYGEGILHSNSSGQISSSALVVGDLPTDIPTANISSTDTLFTLGDNNIKRGENVQSLSGLSNIGLTNELRFADSTSKFKMEYSTALGVETLTTKYSGDELQQYRLSGGVYKKTNKINVINEGYNNFDTSSNYLRINILPNNFAVANEDATTETPVYILRNPTSTSASKVKFGAMHSSSSVEMYYYIDIKYGYEAYQVRVNSYKESDATEDDENLKIFTYHIDDTAQSWVVSSGLKTNETYTFDPADNVKTTSIDSPYILGLQIDTTNSVVIKGGFLLLKSLI